MVALEYGFNSWNPSTILSWLTNQHEFHNTLQPLLTISFLMLLTTSHLLVYHNTLISDHLPVCLTRTTQNLSDKGSAHKYIRYRKTEQFDENVFLSDLAQQSWSNINSYEDLSAAANFFKDMLHSNRKRVKKCQQPGWMNQEILNSIKTRDKLHNEKDMNNYNIWRNKVKSLILKSKQEYSMMP